MFQQIFPFSSRLVVRGSEELLASLRMLASAVYLRNRSGDVGLQLEAIVTYHVNRCVYVHCTARYEHGRNGCSCYSSTGHNQSDGNLPVVMPTSPSPPSPSASQVSTPPLSARTSSFLYEVSLPSSACPRRSLDSSSKSVPVTASRALSDRLEAKLARARGEPLTPYLM